MLQSKIRRVILYVSDMSQQVAFYRDVLGLPVLGEPQEDYTEAYWVSFETGECTLSLHGGGTQDFGDDAPKLCFFADDIEAARGQLHEQGVGVSDLREPEPGVSVFDGWDPEGNRFAVESAR